MIKICEQNILITLEYIKQIMYLEKQYNIWRVNNTFVLLTSTCKNTRNRTI